MDTLTERLERLAELQKKNIEPLQSFGSSAFVAFERMARKNYELMGDMVEYAVAQSRGSLEPSSPQALYERQMAEARAFAERMGARTAEYVALAEQLRDEMTPEAPTSAGRSGDDRSTSPTTTRTPVVATTKSEAGAMLASAPKTASKKRAATGRAVAKKTGAKKASAKKTSARKTAAKKASAAGASGRKVSAKKTGGGKATARTASTGKTSAKKTARKKTGGKRGASR